MPRWWASSWITVIRTSSSRSQRVREVLLEREPEDRDRVGEGHVVRAPCRPRRAVVEAVERLVAAQAVLPALGGRRLVGDDDRDLVEGGGEGHRDAGEGAVDEALEADVARLAAAAAGGELGGGDPSAALRHGGAIVGRDGPAHRPRPRCRSSSAPCRPPDRTAEPAGFVVASDDGTRIHFLDWGPRGRPGSGRALRSRAGVARRAPACCCSTAWRRRPGAGPPSPAASRVGPRRRHGPPRPRALRRADRRVRPGRAGGRRDRRRRGRRPARARGRAPPAARS